MNILTGGEGADTFAPSSISPTEIVAHTGTNYFLTDYDEDEDTLI